MADTGWRFAFEKLMALHAIEPGCIESLRQLTCRIDVDDTSFVQAVKGLEAALAQKSAPEAERALAPAGHKECLAVIGLAYDSTRLLERLRTGPSLGSLPRSELAPLLHLADLHDDPDDGVTSADAPFVRLLRFLNNAGTVNTEALLRENLGHLIALARQFPQAAEYLGRAARGAAWTTEMQALEALLDPKGPGPFGAGQTDFGPDAEALLKMVRGAEPAQSPSPPPPPSPLQLLLLQHPRFSTLTREEVLGFEKVRAEYADQSRPLFTSDLGDVSDRDQSLAAANALMGRKDWAAELTLMKHGLDRRAELARYYRKLRSIAKLDALERNWPDIYQIVRTDLGRMMALDDRLTATTTPGVNLPNTGDELWNRCVSDRNLAKLMSLRPRFRDINPVEYERYQKLAKQSPVSVPSPSGGTVPVGYPTGSWGTPVVPVIPVAVPSSATPPHYLPLDLTIAAGTSDGQYTVSLGGQGVVPAESEVTPNLSAISSEIDSLRLVEKGAPMTREVVVEDRNPELNELLRTIGEKLYEEFIQGDVATRLQELLETSQYYRIFLKLSAAPLANLPWEALYLPSLDTAVSLTQRTSLVRFYAQPAGTPPPPFSPPLRVLVVIPRPPNLPPLNGAQEKQILAATLSPSESRGLVKLKYLEDEEASREEFRAALRREKPHVIQFIGHGRYDQSSNKGQLVFQEGTKHSFMESDDLSVVLRDTRVGLVVLNGCDTGTSSSNDALSSVAAAIVAAGVPAAVATMREVYDEAALRFTREFYRAFVDGYTLESSLIEARKALYVENWNWSAYALFSSIKPDLDFLRLVVPPGRSSPTS